MRSAALVVCLCVLSQPALAFEDGVVTERSLADEACRLSMDQSPRSRGMSIFRILCNDQQVGLLMPNNQLRQTEIEQRLRCERPRPLLESGPLAAIEMSPCRAKTSGIPYALYRFSAHGKDWIADGLPTAIPPMLSLARQPVLAAGQRQAIIDRLPDLWGASLPLLTAAELHQLQTTLRDARLANEMEQFAEAERLNRALLALQTKIAGPESIAALETRLDLGLNVSNQGRAEEAQALFRGLETSLAETRADFLQARLKSYRAMDAANRGEFREALLMAQDAIRSWQALVNDPSQAVVSGMRPGEISRGRLKLVAELVYAQHLEAAMLFRTGEAQVAYERAGDALRQSKGIPIFPKSWQADILMTLGEVSVGMGRIAAAEEFFKAALTIRESVFGPTMPAIRTLIVLARAFHAEGMDTAAVATYRQAFLRMLQRAGGRDDFLSREELGDFVGSAFALISSGNLPSAQQLQLLEEVFFAMQSIRPSVVDETITRSALALAGSDPSLAPQLRQIADLERLIRSKRAELAELSILPIEDKEKGVEERLRLEVAASERQRSELRRALESKSPDYTRLAAPKPLALNALQRVLRPEEAYAYYLVGRKVSHALLVQSTGVQLVRVPVAEKGLDELVAGFRKGLVPVSGRLPEFSLSVAFDLYQVTVAPFAQHLKSTRSLIVQATGSLSSVPFSAMVTSRPAKTEQVSQSTPWLAHAMAVSYSPSLHGFVAQRSARRAVQPKRAFIGVGNPGLEGVVGPTNAQLDRLAGNCRSDRPAPAEQIRALARLPDTASEIKSVAAKIAPKDNAPWRLGKDATEAAFRRLSLADYRVLYFATHALLPGELRCQSEPALVLTPPPQTASDRASDGLLQASEIVTLRLNADLVVLSACNTAGGGRGQGGEALTGLAEAFFYAGARSLLVSHWQVPSAPTAELMVNVFGSLAASSGGPIQEALRQAQIKMLSNAKTRHPFFWAAFALVGDGAGAASMPATTVSPSKEKIGEKHALH